MVMSIMQQRRLKAYGRKILWKKKKVPVIEVVPPPTPPKFQPVDAPDWKPPDGVKIRLVPTPEDW